MNMSMNPAFEVSLDPTFNPEDTPMTGEQYLQKVIYERERCPDIVTVPIEPRKVKDQVPCIPLTVERAPCPLHLVPTKEWQQYQIKKFSRIRNKVQCMLSEDIEVENAKQLLDLVEACSDSPENAENLFVKVQPLINVVILITQNMWWKLIKHQITLLKNIADNITISDGPGKIISECIINQENTSHSSSWLGPWIYAALLCIKTPLEPEMHDQLRKLVAVLTDVRYALKKASFMETTHLAIPICIVANVFEQYDLAD